MAALLAYMAIRPAIGGPLFVFEDGSSLTSDKLVAAVREVLQQVGILFSYLIPCIFIINSSLFFILSRAMPYSNFYFSN